MSARRSLRPPHGWLTAGAAAILVALVGPAQLAVADGVDEAQRQVDRTAAELEKYRDDLGRIEENYSNAQERQTELQQEIAESQVRIDEMQSQLGTVQTVLTDIAVDRFVTGDSFMNSPLFASASSFIEGEQKSALGLAAIDSGASSMDSLQALFDQLSDEQTRQERKKQELGELITTLETQQADYESLEKEYTEKLAQAKRDLGEAKLKEAEERRAAAARVSRRSASSGGSTSSTRSSGGSSGGGGGGAGGGSYPAPSSRAQVAVNAALSQIGVPYKYATANPGVSFDCSGLTAWAWERAGVSLPHQSGRQYSSTAHVPLDQAQPGDLIFYYTPIGHVALYIGGGRIVHAAQPGTNVTIATVSWNKVVGVGRP